MTHKQNRNRQRKESLRWIKLNGLRKFNERMTQSLNAFDKLLKFKRYFNALHKAKKRNNAN